MRRLGGLLWRWLRRGVVFLAVLLVALLGIRVIEAERGQPLRPWHTVVPPELDAAAIDRADWPAWLRAEDAAFAAVRAKVTDQLAPEDRVVANRYFAGSPLYTPGFARDWNRSFLLEPAGPPRGAVVLLHGLTDAPYSLRHVAEFYRARGFLALGMRMPGHGTVPAGLTAAVWEDWAAATRLAVRTARARVPAPLPLHLVGYSNGGALATQYALDALENPALPRADRVVLLSPMIGVTEFARFSGVAALPALLPRFARTAWLDVLPEFNPFKYNSFPANAGRQSWRLSSTLQAQIARLHAAGRLAEMPPVLAFQSVADATVSTPAVVSALFARLPANGSELVLFDLNRSARIESLVAPGALGLLEGLLPPAPRTWRATVVSNAAPEAEAVVARSTPPGAAAEMAAPLGLDWPREMYSLAHIALPFPLSDGLYGLRPDPADHFGARLGALAPRGERGVLVVGIDLLMRASSNPFFPYVLERIGAGLP
ncbi:MAG: alpha/beta hydrolase [Acetobacteraceae bacterium]|nr:alpha/beta hydrolase [Acetobacteraceae bacterium]